MPKFRSSAIAVMLVLGTSMSPAYAATKHKDTFSTAKIVMGNVSVTTRGFVALDWKIPTTYLPLDALKKVLQANGYSVKWNASKARLDIQAPEGVSVDLKRLKPGYGSAGIYLNGTLVQRFNPRIAKDPISGASTIYIPIWYFQQVLKHVGLNSSWLNHVWSIKPGSSYPIVLTSNKTYGSLSKQTKLKENLIVLGTNVIVQNVKVQGSVYLNPGPTGDVVLNNVTVTGRIVVESGATASIHLNNVQAPALDVVSSTPVHIVTEGNTSIQHTDIAPADKESVILDQAGGSFGSVVIEAPHSVTLSGNRPFDDVQVQASSTVNVAGSSQISSLTVAASNVKISISSNASVSDLTVKSGQGITVQNNGTVGTLNNQSSSGSVQVGGSGTVTKTQGNPVKGSSDNQSTNQGSGSQGGVSRAPSQPKEVTVSGPSMVNLPTPGNTTTAQYAATVTDQYGQPMNGEPVTWSLEGAPTGVSIDPNTGVLSVTGAAQAGQFTVVATDSHGNVSGKVQVTLQRAASVPKTVTVSGPDTVDLPIPGQTTTANYTATVTDQYGQPMNGEPVTWRLEGAPTGVSIDQNTGVLTVTDAAQAGQFTVVATDSHGNVSGKVQVTLQRAASVPKTVTVSGPDTVDLPTRGETTTANYTATVTDQYGQPMNGEPVTWRLEGAPTGVSIDQNTGVLTVTDAAQAGQFTVVATVSNSTVKGTKTVTLRTNDNQGTGQTGVVLQYASYDPVRHTLTLTFSGPISASSVSQNDFIFTAAQSEDTLGSIVDWIADSDLVDSNTMVLTLSNEKIASGDTINLSSSQSDISDEESHAVVPSSHTDVSIQIDNEANTGGVLTRLTAPHSVSLRDGTLSWDENYDATGYQIKVTDENRKIVARGWIPSRDITDAPLIPLMDPGNLPASIYNVTVTALGDGQTSSDSPPSVLTYEVKNQVDLTQLGAPQPMYMDDGTVQWHEVSNAWGYSLTVTDDNTGEIVARIGYDRWSTRDNLTTFGLSTGIYTVTMKALGDGQTSSDSPQSSFDLMYATFDKNTSSEDYVDVSVKLTQNANNLVNIMNGDTPLSKGDDYIVAGNTVTISRDYLATLPVGPTTLTFDFSGGDSVPLTVMVDDTSQGNTDVQDAQEDHGTYVASVDNNAKTVTVAYGTTAANLKGALVSKDGTQQAYTVLDSQGQLVPDSTVLSPGDKLIVTAQDGNEATYSILVLAASFNIQPIFAPGRTTGSTSIMVTPNTDGNTIKVLVSSSSIPAPLQGSEVPHDTEDYTSGNDLKVNEGDYVAIYEIDNNNNVVAFFESTVTASDILQEGSFRFQPTVGWGTKTGTIAIGVTPNIENDNIKVLVSSSPIQTLLPGSLAPSEAQDYIYNSDLRVSAGDYVAVYEVDQNNHVVAFYEFNVADADIAQVDQLNSWRVEPGSKTGTIKILVTPNTQGDSLKVKVSNSYIERPSQGHPVPFDAQDYTSGTDLMVTAGDYVAVYEVDNNNNVVAFALWGVLESDIAKVDSFITQPTFTPGSVIRSTRISVHPNTEGDNIKVLVSNIPIQTPLQGSPVSSSAKDYTPDSDLTVTVGDYVAVYEVDSNNNVVAFYEDCVTPPEVTQAASWFNDEPQVEPGSKAGTTKILVMPNTDGDKIKVQVSSSAISMPIMGSEVPSDAQDYIPGSDLQVTAGEFLGIYEVDNNNKVVAFSEVWVTEGQIAQETTEAFS
jgi:mRNA-degrading endonuclease RelE of RelBE toxin-antitoxin system